MNTNQTQDGQGQDTMPVPVVQKRAKRGGSGRTKGSYSFVRISVGDLVAKLDPAIQCLVSRKWAEAVGFTGLTAKPAGASYESIQGQTPETRVAVTTTDLNS